MSNQIFKRKILINKINQINVTKITWVNFKLVKSPLEPPHLQIQIVRANLDVGQDFLICLISQLG